MDYLINPSAMAAAFFVPSQVVDTHLKLATERQLKVLLYFLKNASSGTDENSISAFLKISKSEVLDALEFWVQSGVLTKTSSIQSEKTAVVKEKALKPKTVKPTRNEISSVALGDKKLVFLMQEAEMKYGRAMRDTEIRTLGWLYLDCAMDVSIILMLVEYAVNEGKPTVSFIESTALDWMNSGVSTLAEAEEQIETRNRRKTAWGMIESAFGIERRKPSDKELEYAERWIIEWRFSKEMLKEAYNRCIDQKAKLNMSYINGILERWYRDGVFSLKDEKPKKKSKDKNDFAGYDKSLVYELFTKDD